MANNIETLLEKVKQYFNISKNLPNMQVSEEPKSEIGNDSSGFQVPIKSEYHNSGGFDPNGKGKVGKIHPAVDLRAPGGTSVYPIASGVVTAVRVDPKGGNTVNLKHNNGYASYYAHLGTISVREGQKVFKNTLLGTVGDSGNAKGFAHLHLQVYKDKSLIDPASIMSIPEYTAFNPKKEKLWLPGAQEIAQNFSIKKNKKYANKNDYDLFVEEQIFKLQNKFPNVKLHSFSKFQNFIDEIIPKLIHKYMLRTGAMKICSTISPDFSEIASNAGFPVLVQHTPGHVRNIVLTIEGPYLVDLSYIQYLCKHDLMDKNVRKEAIESYKELYNNPFKAVKIEPLSKEYFQGISIPETNNNYNPVKMFEDYDIEEEEELFPEKFKEFKDKKIAALLHAATKYQKLCEKL